MTPSDAGASKGDTVTNEPRTTTTSIDRILADQEARFLRLEESQNAMMSRFLDSQVVTNSRLRDEQSAMMSHILSYDDRFNELDASLGRMSRLVSMFDDARPQYNPSRPQSSRPGTTPDNIDEVDVHQSSLEYSDGEGQAQSDTVNKDREDGGGHNQFVNRRVRSNEMTPTIHIHRAKSQPRGHRSYPSREQSVPNRQSDTEDRRNRGREHTQPDQLNFPDRDRPPHMNPSDDDSSSSGSDSHRRGRPDNTASPRENPEERSLRRSVSHPARFGSEVQTDGNLDYQRRLTDSIRMLIRRMVGTQPDYPSDFKGTKPNAPDVYDGMNDIEVFDNWLRTVLRYFQLSKMCGRKYDTLRVTHTGQFLKDTAAAWFRNTVEGAVGDQDWIFEEVIVELFRRFVHGSSAQKAKNAYEGVEYNEQHRVHAYHLELEMKSRRLIVLPDEYSFRSRFLDGLPMKIQEILIRREHMTAEHNTIEELVRAVYNIEESNEAYARKARGAAGPSTTPQITISKASRIRRDRSRKPSFRSQPQPIPNAIPAEKRTMFIGSNSRPTGNNDRKVDREITCFACGQKGHYASDPKCPRYGQGAPQNKDHPQLRASRAEIEDHETEQSPPDTQGNREEQDVEDDQYDGSQYDPDDEGSDLEDSSDHADNREPAFTRAIRLESDSEEEDDMVYIRAARARTLQKLQEEHPSRSAMRKKEDRSNRTKEKESCMTAWITINGTRALTLFDSGSTADSISPDFSRVADLKCFKLDKQVPLQLGCMGSRANINFGTRSVVQVLERVDKDYYFDIVNIDRYDCIVGVPFMRHHEVVLDFKNNSINIHGDVLPALLPAEEATILQGRKRIALGGSSQENQ
jgi:hypothetical protein